MRTMICFERVMACEMAYQSFGGVFYLFCWRCSIRYHRRIQRETGKEDGGLRFTGV